MIEIDHCVSKSLLAPILIGFGGIIFVFCQSSIVGSVLFAGVLLLIQLFKLNSFVDKCGFIADPQDMRRLILVLVLNLSVVFIFGLIIKLFTTNVSNIIDGILTTRDSNLMLYIVKSMIAGILMTSAVHSLKNNNSGSGVLTFLLCTFIIIYTGCPHCVIELFYYSASTVFYDNLSTLICNLLLSILFNFIGCNLYNLFIHKSFIYKGIV